MRKIHTGGRLYDPLIGRFLSADPSIQSPTNSQSLNRYSYCLNNPIAYTDPSGYSWFSDLIDDIGNIFHAIGDAIVDAMHNKYFNLAMEITIGCLTGGNFWLSSFLVSTYSGFAAYAQTGSINFAMETAGLTFAAAASWHLTGDFIKYAKMTNNTLFKVGAHALVGGGLSVAEGGDFQNGFLSAAASEAIPINNLGKGEDVSASTIMMERTGAAAIVGGTVAAATGGNFVNGAKTSAFAELYNDCAHAATGDNNKSVQHKPIKRKFNMVDWAKHHLSATLQINAAYGVGLSGSANFDAKGVDFCGGLVKGYGFAGTATVDFYEGPDLSGVTAISTIAAGSGFGGYISGILTGGGPGFGAGGGAGIGFYAGTVPGYCGGRISYSKIAHYLDYLI